MMDRYHSASFSRASFRAASSRASSSAVPRLQRASGSSFSCSRSVVVDGLAARVVRVLDDNDDDGRAAGGERTKASVMSRSSSVAKPSGIACDRRILPVWLCVCVVRMRCVVASLLGWLAFLSKITNTITLHRHGVRG